MAQDTDKEREPLSRIARLRERLARARRTDNMSDVYGVVAGILDLLEDDYRLGTQEDGS